MLKNNINNRSTFTTMVVCCIVLFTYCHKDHKICNNPTDPECANYDPCSGKKAANADFKILEFCSIDKAFESDTVASFTFVYLKATYKNASYKWIITGLININDSVFTDSIVNLYHLLPEWKYITAKLIVTQNLGNCKGFKTSDTLTKTFYVWGEPSGTPPFKYYPIWGTYKGTYLSNPNQQVEVTLFDTVRFSGSFTNHCDSSNLFPFPFHTNLLKGLPFPTANLADLRKNTTSYVYQGFGASSCYINILAQIGRLQPPPVDGCTYTKTFPMIRGYAWLDYNNSNKIYIQYSWIDTLNVQQIYNDVFTGYRM